MTLMIDNQVVGEVLTMQMTIDALDEAYRDMIAGTAVCRPRVDVEIPTPDADRTFRWGTMEGGSARGYFAIRMKSDIMYDRVYGDTRTREKYCMAPGTFCGLIFLFRVADGEPLAIINDGVLQHKRVGADSAIGVKYMAREDARVVGMFGSGGMARSHIEAFRRVRDVHRVQVFSPTRAHREAYAAEVREIYGIEAIPLSDPLDVYKGADILCSCTDASVPVIQGRCIEPGTHVTSVGGRPDMETFRRIDRFLRLGNATVPTGHEKETLDEFFSYRTPAAADGLKPAHAHAKGAVKAVNPENVLYLKDILAGGAARNSAEQITYSERGNLQGAQFYPVAARVYEAAVAKGLGRELPTAWFLQDVRD